MLSIPPKLSYRGLTIIMSNPSRFDDKELLSGNGGYYFKKWLQPETNIHLCDTRLIDDSRSLLPGTKCILLLGEKAHRLYTKANTNLDENRGSPIIVNGIPTVSSFTPQDCMDYKDYESERNPLHQSVEEFLSDEIAAGEIVASKGRNKTARSNYAFWLQHDIKKCCAIVNNNGQLPPRLLPYDPNYIIRPNSSELIHILSTTKNDTMHVDIETDFQSLDIRCVAFSFENTRPENIYIFPVLDIFYKPAYDNLHVILKALAVAFRDNCTVAHNGALFDFPVFAYKYHIPVGRKLYDTMVAQQRIYPEIEKSLGHSMSMHTYEPYHKDEGNHSYRSNSQAEQLYYYCGKDVFGMKLVKRAQELRMAQDEGLRQSIMWSMRAIRPYMIQTFLGMKYNEEKRQAWIKKNERLMIQYMRFMELMIGSGKNSLPVGSNKKDVEYFHNQLGYKAVARGKNGPSLKEEALIKLKQIYPDNMVIDFLLKYRAVKKEAGILRFKPWISEKPLTGLEEFDGGDDE